MAIRTSSAVWEGDSKRGHGKMRVGDGVFEGAYTHASRFEHGEGTNPEELIGAAHAGCFSMYLSSLLTSHGHTVNRITTIARVHLDEGPRISLIELETEGDVPGIEMAEFRNYAEQAESGCPVSRALSAVPMQLTTRLVRMSKAA